MSAPALRKHWGLIGALFLLPITTTAQETVFKFGDVSEHDFTVMPVDGQESANAFIIYDYGEFYIDDRLNSVFTRHKRMRILNETGLKYGDGSISYISRKNLQEVRELKAQVYTMGADGRIQKRALRSKDFFRESVNSTFSRVKFSIPDLQPGSVIEISYQIRSLNPTYIPSWTFQSSEPTLYSEMSAFIPNALRYDPVFTGYVQMEPPVRVDYFEGDRPNILYTTEGGTRFRYVAADVPALNEEAYTANIDNYLSTIRFNLSKVQFYGQRSQNYANTWPEVGKALMDDSEVGGRLRSHRVLARLAETLTAGLTDSLARATAIYEHVTSTMRWNESYGFWGNRHSDDVVRELRGDSGELAYLLINLLREAGFDAQPVLISTRDNGILLPVYPIPSQFNHVLARLRIGGKTYFLDAISPDLPFGTVDSASLNERGFLLVKDQYTLIPIESAETFKSRSMLTLEVGSDGSGSGTMQSSLSGYHALMMRDEFKDGNESDVYLEYLDAIRDVQLDSMLTTGLDTRNTPVVMKAEFHSAAMAESAGDLLLINPILIHRWGANPFTSTTRVYPIDFPYPMEATLNVNLSLPEGYGVESLPQSQRFGMGTDASFSIIYAQSESGLQVMCSYRIQKTQFLPDQYAALKAFFNRMVDAQQQQIVLKKITE